MKPGEHTDRHAQDALREAILKELTGSYHGHELLKEHYDRLQELTNISKKTLKRFFREKIRVGPQTRNLLAAIALGRKEDLHGLSVNQQDYYLTFIESLDLTNTPEEKEPKNEVANPEFRKVLAKCYASESFFDKPLTGQVFLPLTAVKKRLERDIDHFTAAIGETRFTQELVLDALLLFNHSRPVLLGEAGLGKSAFARNLCLEWSSIDKQQGTVPIYIDLKSPSYNRGGHGVFDFLVSEYFGAQQDWMVIDFLENESAGYYLLLDGFDDLLVEEKESLMREVACFSADVRYLILSRPYGFHDFSYPSRSVYEVHGFDPKVAKKFLRQALVAQGQESDVDELCGYLRSHPVLSGLSRSPLNLKRIAALAPSDKLYTWLGDVSSELDLLHIFNSFTGGKT
jgi:hypothetical protein